MEQEELIPTPELKRQALCRRTDKLLSWLQRDDYANYVDLKTTDQLLKLIDLAIWAFETSIPKHEWKPLLDLFIEAKNAAVIFAADDNSKVSIYNNALRMLSVALVTYKDFIANYDELDITYQG